jgi:hypothetical protein
VPIQDHDMARRSLPGSSDGAMPAIGAEDPDASREHLAESVRRLIDAAIRTQVDPNIVVGARSKIDSAIADLSSDLIPGGFGWRVPGE